MEGPFLLKLGLVLFHLNWGVLVLAVNLYINQCLYLNNYISTHENPLLLFGTLPLFRRWTPRLRLRRDL